MTVAKIGASDEYIGSFLGSLLDSSEANRVYKDDVSLLVFPGTTPSGNLPTLQAEASG